MAFVGTAGWTIPRASKIHFDEEGSHLERYSRFFNAVEINSSFYREHGANTYERWARETPPGFRFSVKLSRAFTQEHRLRETGPTLAASIANVSLLGEKLGWLLVQLPPSLEYNALEAAAFFRAVRATYRGPVALEPRNLTWTGAAAVLEDFGITRVHADPERCYVRSNPKVPYYRLHGSPVIYRSAYPDDVIAGLARKLRLHPEGWCIFDNTTLGFATENARSLWDRLNC